MNCFRTDTIQNAEYQSIYKRKGIFNSDSIIVL